MKSKSSNRKLCLLWPDKFKGIATEARTAYFGNTETLSIAGIFQSDQVQQHLLQWSVAAAEGQVIRPSTVIMRVSCSVFSSSNRPSLGPRYSGLPVQGNLIHTYSATLEDMLLTTLDKTMESPATSSWLLDRCHKVAVSLSGGVVHCLVDTEFNVSTL